MSSDKKDVNSEPLDTYSPCQIYCPPKGRLAILGKARAAVDKVRSTVEADYASIAIQIAAQKDNHYKIHEEMRALQVQTDQLVLKTTQEIAASVAAVDQAERRTVSDISLATKKTDSEVCLLEQKAVTELGQTADTLPTPHPGMNLTTDIGGVVGKQKDLFQKQTDGFDRDAEQKLAKILVDTWTVRQTTDGAMADSAGVQDSEIHRVLSKAKNGIKY